MLSSEEWWRWVGLGAADADLLGTMPLCIGITQQEAVCISHDRSHEQVKALNHYVIIVVITHYLSNILSHNHCLLRAALS